MPLTRRSLLGMLSTSTFFLSVPKIGIAEAQLPDGAGAVSFPQGVASGDPHPNAVMLWTRAVPSGEGTTADLLLQVSPDETFKDILLQEHLSTTAGSDFTLRAYVDGLEPDTWYYYRFLGAGSSHSRTGRTRTAPSSDQQRDVKLAFASCQHYEQAHYGAWARMLEDDKAAEPIDQIQFVLHLGDFIYERQWNLRPDGQPQPRRVPPLPDGVESEETRHAVSLADYRHLYKTYLSDPHLQEARARWPFVCIWDDHEFSNDNFQSYSTYGEEPILDAQRKLDANQAWFEYIPSVLDEDTQQSAHGYRRNDLTGDEASDNVAARDSLRIYRKLSWGSLVDMVLTDTRSYRSAPCLPEALAGSLGLPMASVRLVEIADAGTRYNDGDPPATLPYGDGSTPNPGRDRPPGTLLGKEQREWFLDTLEASTARWKLWGNALPLIPMRLDLSSLPLAGYEDGIFNIDPWSGYPHEQALLMNHLEQKGISAVVSLSGDHHMHGAGTVSHSASDPDAPAVAVDFTVAGISSVPMFDELVAVAREDYPDFQPLVYREEAGEIIPVWNASLLRGSLAAYSYAKTGLGDITRWLGPNSANPGLRYVDSTASGYGLATFSAENLQVDLITMADCLSPFTTAPQISHTASFKLPLWQPGEQPSLVEPEFKGGAPFPFEPPTV